MRALVLFAACFVCCSGCSTAKYSWNVDKGTRPHRAEVNRIAIISRGSDKPVFLKSFTQFATGTFSYRGYNCTGFYYDSASLQDAEMVAKRVAALKPALTIALYRLAADDAKIPDTLAPLCGNRYRIDVWRGWGTDKRHLAKGVAAVINETDVSGADFRRMTSRFCRELLLSCVIYPAQPRRRRH